MIVEKFVSKMLVSNRVYGRAHEMAKQLIDDFIKSGNNTFRLEIYEPDACQARSDGEISGIKKVIEMFRDENGCHHDPDIADHLEEHFKLRELELEQLKRM